MNLKKTSLISFVGVLTITIVFSLPSKAEETLDADHDFKFMEIQRDLHENPNGPQAREELFAIGEYYFQEQNPSLAADYFKRFGPSELKKTEDLIATAYLAQCAKLTGDTGSEGVFKEKMEEMLSSQSYFVSFNNKRVWSWRSPLGNRFDFRELVDRMEILINDNLFYTISLS